ncbi:hypothetical protein ACP70R_000269 [Stipagrostis hirtigluma subsp. patula]
MSTLCFLFLVLLSIVLLPQKYEGCQNCHTVEEPSTRAPHQSEDVSDEDVYYFAAHSSFPGQPYDGYYGFIATIDVYGHNISHGQMSGSTVWVSNSDHDSADSINSIHVGWMVSPEVYGNSHTHFYTYWTRDGLGNSGCYNMDCPGFQLEQRSKIAPGAIIRHVSEPGWSHNTMTVKVFKEKSSGNWWVYCGLNNDTPTAIGYYPANLFTSLATKADEIAFGGEASAKRSLPTPPMGSGFLPSENAASISNL